VALVNPRSTAVRAPYGRDAKYAPAASAGAPVTTYYGQPQLKRSHWGVRVALYIFIAGLSGAAQMIAAAADLAGGESCRGTVRRGRHIALLAVAVGPPLLIADLHTPQRFYNMLRIFRRTSPMSIGTYVLSSFSLFSIVTAFAQLMAERNGGGWNRLARTAQLPAALAGAGMTTYTAALLAATSTPLWAAAPRALGVQFAGSAIAAAAGALQLAGRIDGDDGGAAALEGLALAAAATELVGALAAERQCRRAGIGDALALHRPWGALHQLGAVGLGAAVPVAVHAGKLAGRRPRPRLMLTAALAVLAGSFALRLSVLGAGNDSAERPQQSLGFASGRNRR
jgi:formate-dependent nitrite reductase membrane component NrfD